MAIPLCPASCLPSLKGCFTHLFDQHSTGRSGRFPVPTDEQREYFSALTPVLARIRVMHASYPTPLPMLGPQPDGLPLFCSLPLSQPCPSPLLVTSLVLQAESCLSLLCASFPSRSVSTLAFSITRTHARACVCVCVCFPFQAGSRVTAGTSFPKPQHSAQVHGLLK